MTDKEIYEAYECCITGGAMTMSSALRCGECPYFHRKRCVSELKVEVFGLLHRQKSEIERLKAEIKKPVCMPGDKVYQFSDGAVYESTVKNIIYDCGHIAFEEAAIGKQVFLTREAAERGDADNGEKR